MSVLDWIVLLMALGGAIAYGIYKSKSEQSLSGYFKSNNSMSWYIVLVSIMATQASAVTFLSAPGQAYTDGMRFVQYYFGLPLAMIVLCVTFVPMFHKLKVFTAYEFLEQRFDLRTRALTSILFLISRGLSTGISIYAPSIILSSLMGWNIYLTNLVMGGLLIIYTVSGGARAVAYTQLQQLLVVFIGMFLAGWMVVRLLPDGIGFVEAIQLAGQSGKMNIIETRIDVTDSSWWKDKYNIWSGLIGGFFLALSYFGTDQSQVGRYLTAKDIKESRLGLLMNGLVKVPMQFLILMIGVLVFSFYLFYDAPLVFNQKLTDKVLQTTSSDTYQSLMQKQDSLNAESKLLAKHWVANNEEQSKSLTELKLQLVIKEKERIREEAKKVIKQATAGADTNDTNYIFLYFVLHHLPKGLIGLLIAVIFLSAWGSIAAALNSLCSSTMIDLYKRIWFPNKDEIHYYKASRWLTLFWGVFCIGTAMFASKLGSLIEAVNILGSLFYGTMLGIFVVAFYVKQIGAKAVFWSAVVAEAAVIVIYILDIVSFLWLNVIGCLLVVLCGYLIQQFQRKNSLAA
jgi:SSS family solute:Na+ symporter